MAGRIAGITVEIGGDTTKLQTALKGVDGQLRQTQSALKDINKLLKLDPGNTELLVQKQKNLEKAINETKDRLKQLRTHNRKFKREQRNGMHFSARLSQPNSSLNSLKRNTETSVLLPHSRLRRQAKK